MPLDMNALTWQTLFDQSLTTRIASLNELFQAEINNPHPDLQHLTAIQYLKSLCQFQQFNRQSMAILLKSSCNYVEPHQPITTQFQQTFQQTMHTLLTHLPTSVSRPLHNLYLQIMQQPGRLNQRYCFLAHHADWLLKDSSNFIYQHSDQQHQQYLQTPIDKYIHRYFYHQIINHHIIKSNLPPYVQFKLELATFTNAGLTILHRQWLPQLPPMKKADLQALQTFGHHPHAWSLNLSTHLNQPA